MAIVLRACYAMSSTDIPYAAARRAGQGVSAASVLGCRTRLCCTEMGVSGYQRGGGSWLEHLTPEAISKVFDAARSSPYAPATACPVPARFLHRHLLRHVRYQLGFSIGTCYAMSGTS
eukprot:237154-Rhodomonas_salina.1